MNILSNGIDAIENFQSSLSVAEMKSYSGYILIKTQQVADNLVEISITDNGGGIKEEVRSRIFDPFLTTKSIGKGTGLGLAIAYQILVHKHQEKLESHSQIGKGTEFLIAIPINIKSG
ncbi:MAG: ATP-binding protein [Microcoleaceae cyanobacterium MO_207.B10]|nr:ATP-binding protein [Microcoleaceae cyanobacterium MO_207.B10]